MLRLEKKKTSINAKGMELFIILSLTTKELKYKLKKGKALKHFKQNSSEEPMKKRNQKRKFKISWNEWKWKHKVSKFVGKT